jgi:hypothetical protein
VNDFAMHPASEEKVTAVNDHVGIYRFGVVDDFSVIMEEIMPAAATIQAGMDGIIKTQVRIREKYDFY